PRTAFTARPATSRIPRRTSTGPCPKVVVVPTIPTYEPYATHFPRAPLSGASRHPPSGGPPPARPPAAHTSRRPDTGPAPPAAVGDPLERSVSRRSRRRAESRLRHRGR